MSDNDSPFVALRPRRRGFLQLCAGASAFAVSIGGARSALAGPRGGEATPFPSLEPVVLDAESKAAAAALADEIKYDIALSLAGKADAATQARGFGQVVDAYARAQGRGAEAAIRKSAAKLLGASASVKKAHFGPLAVAAPADRHVLSKKTRDKVALIAKRVAKQEAVEQEDKLPNLLEKAKSYSKLDFRLVQVKCVEETDEVGSDHILLGGAAISSMGEKKKIDSFTVGNKFDKGDTRPFPHPLSGNFDPNDMTKGKVLATFDLKSKGAKGYGSPGRSYALSLVMAEHDSGGGFDKLVNGIWDKVGKEVTGAVSTAIAEAIGGWFGAVVGEVVGAVIDFLVDTIFNNKDDLIGYATYEVKIMYPFHGSFTTAAAKAKQAKAPAGLYAAKPKSLVFKGDGGKYVADVSWRVRD